MVGAMVISFKMTYASTALRTLLVSVPDPVADHCRPTPPPETPRHSQASLVQSPVGSLLLSPGFWCTKGFVVLSKTLFPWVFSVLLPDFQVGKHVVGPRTFATV